MLNKRYPNIHILSKNELAKHISHSKFSKTEAQNLINDTTQNFDRYWRDNPIKSEPDKDKYVRSAKGTPLGRLLDCINRIVLAPHDKMLPNFIFGGVSELNHKKAAEHLLGHKRRRIVLKMDIKRFFEQISRNRVFNLFLTRFGCSKKSAKLLADLSCVPIGPKGFGGEHKTIARGFATSSRLAVWSNLDTFIRLDWLVKKRFRGRDARIAIYVDDIGITVSQSTKEEVLAFSTEVKTLLENYDKNQLLPVNVNKTKVTSHEEGMEHLGIRLNRNSLGIGAKTKSKMNRLKDKIKKNRSLKDNRINRDRLRSLHQYKRYVESSKK